MPAGRGRGLAGRAVRIIVAWARSEGVAGDFVLWVRHDNVASSVVAERAGFARDPTTDKVENTTNGAWDMLAYRLS